VQVTRNINVHKSHAIMVQIVTLVQVRIVTHYKYELARLALLAPKCNPYLRCYGRHRFMLSQPTVIFLQFCREWRTPVCTSCQQSWRVSI